VVDDRFVVSLLLSVAVSGNVRLVTCGIYGFEWPFVRVDLAYVSAKFEDRIALPVSEIIVRAISFQDFQPTWS